MVDNATYTYTYLLADAITKDAVIIDPVYEKAERDFRIINELKLNLKFAIKWLIFIFWKLFDWKFITYYLKIKK